MSFPFSFQIISSHYIPPLSSVWYRYEAARSFDLDDDLEFCPGLMSEDEMHYMTSSYSDGSSSSSGSPNSSPLQVQIQPSTSGNSFSSSQVPSPRTPQSSDVSKIQQPSSSSRQRNAIPIVNPHTGMRVSSPPLTSNVSRSTAHPTQLPRRHW